MQDTSGNTINKNKTIFYKVELKNRRHEVEIVDELENYSLVDAFDEWVDTRTDSDNKWRYQGYARKIKMVLPEKFANAENKPFTLGGLRYLGINDIINGIEKQEIAFDEKIELIKFLKAFIAHVNKISHGWFKRIGEAHQAIQPIQQLSFACWRAFIENLDDLNERNGLIARCILQSDKRISEVIKITVDQIDCETNQILFSTGSVMFAANFMNYLKEHITSSAEQRKNIKYVFITREGKNVTRSQLNRSFKKSNIQLHITPEKLRGTFKLFIQRKFEN